MEISPSIEAFRSTNIENGYVRPWGSVNAWSASKKNKKPSLKIEWKTEKELSEIKLFLDSDYDHPLESTLMGHPEEVVPFCLRNYTITDLNGTVLVTKEGNYQTINTWRFDSKIKTKGIIINVEHPSENVPASIFEVICS